MGADPAVEDLVDIALAAITAGPGSGGGDDRSRVIEDSKRLDDSTDIIAIVFGGERDIDRTTEGSDDGRRWCVVRKRHQAASIIRGRKIGPLGIEPGSVLGHGSAAGRHAILQVVGDDRRDIVRSDGNGLYKRSGVAQIIICDPGADDGAAGAELCVVGLR